MKSALDEDIWYILARTINSRQTLATLCRVSRELKAICQPILYREVDIQDCRLEVFQNFVALPQHSHLKYTRRLRLGRNIGCDRHWFHISSSGRENAKLVTCHVGVHLLVECLKKMPNLVSMNNTCFVNYPRFMKDWFPFGIEPTVSRRVAATNEAIHEFISVNPGLHYMQRIRLPHFRNLRKLVLDPLESFHFPFFQYEEILDGIAEVLVLSPCLESLTLTCKMPDSMGIYGINKLARSYALKRKKSRALRLHLKELELGPEFIPHPRRLLPAYMVPEQGYHKNPISQLTMLCYLKRLTLRTELMSLYELQAEVCSYKLDPVCFFPAENLEHISIDTGYWGVYELIKHLCDQDQVKLVSFQDRQFRNCMRSPAGPRYNPWKMDPQNIYHHWETLDLGDIFIKGDAIESQQEVLNELLKCVHLKNLTISLPGRMLQYFRENILPQMTRLETLFIPSGPFDKGVPFVARNLVQTENSFWVEEGHPRQQKYMNRRKEKLEKKHQDNQQIRREIAQALFNSGRPNSNHTGTTMKSRLKYLGLGYRVYTELYAGTSDDGKDRWELFELSPDEAKTFEPIQRQLQEPINVMRGGICHIKITENLPFGAFEYRERKLDSMRLAPSYSNLNNRKRLYRYIKSKIFK